MAQTVNQIAEQIGGTVKGEGSANISSIGTLANASKNQLSFLSNPKYLSDLASTQAGAVILGINEAESYNGTCIIHDNPYVGFALAAQILDTTPKQKSGVHPTAIVDDTVSIGTGVSIGPGAIVEANVVLHDNVTIGANTTVGEGCVLEESVTLKPNVTLYYNVRLGKRVTVHSSTVIGGDGFGYANDKGRWIKIPQTGGVVVGDDTEIGCNTCIDRGALDDTIIGKNCIIDNLVQIAHNVVIGDHSCVCGSSGISGSAVIGKYVVLGGQTGVVGHVKITDGVQATGKTMISKDTLEPGVYSSGFPSLPAREWNKFVAKLRSIPKLEKRVKALESKE